MNGFGTWLESDDDEQREWLEVIQSNYDDLIVRFANKDIGIDDNKTGGRAHLTIDKHFNQDKGDYEGDCIKIVTWNAAPLLDRASGLPNKGGGFARNVMRKILEIAQEKSIKIIEIFGPSNDSNNVLNHYAQTGLLTPIPYSKAVYGDFHTAFYINRYSIK